MIVFKTAMIKFLKSPSTYIPLGLTLIIAITVGVILPFVFLDLDSPKVNLIYRDYVYSSVVTIAPATTLVSASFVAYKAIQIYKQEIEDGSFLILISKPISRKRILLQKWLSMICIILIYIFIIMFFYVIFVYIFDPGDRLENLEIRPLKTKIISVASILFAIIFVLSFLFSSLALVVSTRFSSVATIASITAIGAVIPVSAVIPTFTNESEQSLISNPSSIVYGNKQISNDSLKQISKIINKDELNSKNFSKLQKNISKFSDFVDKNANEHLIKTITISSGKKNKYQYLYGFDLNYQLSMISSISLRPIITKKEKELMALSHLASEFKANPAMGGKVVIEHSNIDYANISKRVLNTLRVYNKLVNSKEYMEIVGPCFDYILSAYQIKGLKPTNSLTFKNNLNKLMNVLYGDGSASNLAAIKSFFSSPLYLTMINDDNISDKLKDKLKTDIKLRYSVFYLQQIVASKILLSLGQGIDLLINANKINKFFLDNNKERISTLKDALAFLKHPTVMNNSLEQILNKYMFISTKTNKLNEKATILLANLFLISTKSPGGINVVSFDDYANKWALVSIYTISAIILCPITFYIILRQNIK